MAVSAIQTLPKVQKVRNIKNVSQGNDVLTTVASGGHSPHKALPRLPLCMQSPPEKATSLCHCGQLFSGWSVLLRESHNP